MAKTPLVHKTETVFAATVQTARALIEALHDLTTDGDLNLEETYRVEQIEETLSDGTQTSEIRIRLAEPV